MLIAHPRRLLGTLADNERPKEADLESELQTVLVVILLSMDFWTVRVGRQVSQKSGRQQTDALLIPQNVSGRVLVGLRFWNQVDEDGTRWANRQTNPILLQRADVMLLLAIGSSKAAM